MKKFSRKREAQDRRREALSRLEVQLKLGTKPFATKQQATQLDLGKGTATVGRDGMANLVCPLSERDKKRINKEIEILKSRLN